MSFVRLFFSDCCSSFACSGCRLVRRFAVGFALEGIGVFVAGCGGVLRGGRCMVSRGRRIKMTCGVVGVQGCGRWCVVGRSIIRHACTRAQTPPTFLGTVTVFVQR